MSKIFCEPLTQVSAASIADAIRTEGYYVFESALSEDHLQAMLHDVDFSSYLVNNNDVGVVRAGQQQFLSHTLAKSKTTFDVVTSKLVRDICSNFFEGRFKLTNQRIYKTHSKAHMPWHTDNNRQSGNKLVAKHRAPGLLFLFYLTDVIQNPFQLVRGSQKWSPDHDEIYLSDKFIDEQYEKDIVTVDMKRGTLILCDTNVVHRAKPFDDAAFERMTLLFQVDEIEDNSMAGHGETILVNTGFLNDRSPELLDFIGCGFVTEYPSFPKTSAATMSPKDLMRMYASLAPLSVRALSKGLVKTLLPAQVLTNIKRWRWHKRAKPTATEVTNVLPVSKAR